MMKKIKVQFRDCDPEIVEFNSEKEAIEYILEDFAESGENRVEDIYDDEENSYSCHWSIELEKN